MSHSATTGRDAKGRFAPGNPGGPGNPYTRQTAKLREAVQDELNEVEVRIIVQRLKARAVGGDIQAIKLVLAYAIGKPEKCFNPDEVDLLEWELRQRLSVPVGEVERLADRLPVRQACAVAEATKSAVALQVGQEIAQRLRERGLLEKTQPIDTRANQSPPARPSPAASRPSDHATTTARPEVRGGGNGLAGATDSKR
jgi:hypothetical protein